MNRRHVVQLLSLITLVILFTNKYEKIKSSNSKRRLTSNDYYANVRGIEVKAFDKWDRHSTPFPCLPENAPATQGIFYIKVPKTSSSMLAKVTSRIAAREYKRHHEVSIIDKTAPTCKTFDPMKHQHAFELNVGLRDKSKSFVWSVIRHPNNRAISHFGMRYANGKVDTSTETFIDNLEHYGAFSPNIQLEFLNLNDTKTLKDERNFPYLVQTVMNEFNFIGIYERLYESMTVLAMLIGVSITDMLFDYQPSVLSRCGSLEQPEWLSSGMTSYLNSDKWKTRETGDFLLYDAVSKSLDLTIDYLGREKVQEQLDNFMRLIYIGTKAGKQIKGFNGCGVPDLHVDYFPYADIDELDWFHKLSPEDKAFVNEMKWKHVQHGEVVL